MNDEEIRPALQKQVDREVFIKSVAAQAQSGYERKRYIARNKIADLAEAKRIEEYYL